MSLWTHKKLKIMFREKFLFIFPFISYIYVLTFYCSCCWHFHVKLFTDALLYGWPWCTLFMNMTDSSYVCYNLQYRSALKYLRLDRLKKYEYCLPCKSTGFRILQLFSCVYQFYLLQGRRYDILLNKKSENCGDLWILDNTIFLINYWCFILSRHNDSSLVSVYFPSMIVF